MLRGKVQRLMLRLPPLLLLAYCGLVLWGTLKPFDFTLHPARDAALGRSSVEWIPFSRLCPNYGLLCPQDTGMNIAMFVPVGILSAFIPGRRGGAIWIIARSAAIGFGLSLAIEIAQYFIPARFPGVTDLLLNTVGAFLGGIPTALLLARHGRSPRETSGTSPGSPITEPPDDAPRRAAEWPARSGAVCNSMAKRGFDLVFSILGITLLAPLFLLIAAAVKLSDRGPVFYGQCRIGQFGRPFRIWKFRSMVANADKLGLSITKDGDPRVTRIGKLLRKSKLDELPQLWNVLKGDMSFVGPRPEVPRYVDCYTEEQKRVLDLKPGITDLATLEFRNEEELLRTAADTESFYLSNCVPRKIELNLAYAAGANLREDTKIILRTLFKSLPLRSHVEKTQARAGATSKLQPAASDVQVSNRQRVVGDH